MKFLTSTYTHKSKQALSQSCTDTHICMVVHKHFSVHWKLKTHKLTVGQERDACSTYYIEEKEILRPWTAERCRKQTASSPQHTLYFLGSISWPPIPAGEQMCKVSSSLSPGTTKVWFHVCSFTTGDCPRAYQHLFLTRTWENTAKPPSELLTYLNANDLLVLYPTRSTAYQDVRMGR